MPGALAPHRHPGCDPEHGRPWPGPQADGPVHAGTRTPRTPARFSIIRRVLGPTTAAHS